MQSKQSVCERNEHLYPNTSLSFVYLWVYNLRESAKDQDRNETHG